ncbi:ice-binding family protein [Proteiniclasticum sp. C24MP]|uniref:ice-binding family protein n=1 Tax=Proteiniclasticum sp. C24MP TaxID=3374101 RepID=UPI003754EB0C
MKKRSRKKMLSLLLTLALFAVNGTAQLTMAAEAEVKTGTTENFAILSGETITNTGTTEVMGDVGIHPGIEVVGLSEDMVTGAMHLADEVALAAKNDLVIAYDDAAGRTPQIISRELAGQTLTPGVYTSNEKDFLLTGKLILDGEGDPDAVFIFQTDTTLTTGSGSSVEFAGNATACGVFWKVGSSATLGSNSSFAGSILALTSITLETGATVNGRLLARNGSVVLDSNVITSGPCTQNQSATLHVIKMVVNRNGRTAVSEDFSVHVLKDGLDVSGSPDAGMETPGRTYTLEAGNYVVTEEPVEGYEASFSGDSTDGKVTLSPGEEKTVIITNTSSAGSIDLFKTDEKGNPLSGAEFTLYREDVEVGEPMSTDENGNITFTGLAKGTYKLKETKAPEGYVLSEVAEEIILTQDEEIVEISFTNTMILGRISIVKVDGKTGAALSGAEFRITDGKGTEVFQGETDDEGMVTAELPYGDYTVQEMKAPENYEKSEKTYAVSIVEDGQIIDLEVENTKMEKKAATLPDAGDTSGNIFLLLGGLALTGGLLLWRKRSAA